MKSMQQATEAPELRLNGEGGDPYDEKGVRTDAMLAAHDFVDRVLGPKLRIDGDEISLGSDAVFALGHLIAALPDHLIEDLRQQCSAAIEAEERGKEPQAWRPPHPSEVGRA
jgi:hypothetical protein